MPKSEWQLSYPVAIIIGIFFGGVGFHLFYVRRWKSGLVYLLFFWTFLPAILSWITLFKWVFCMSEARWHEIYEGSYHVDR